MKKSDSVHAARSFGGLLTLSLTLILLSAAQSAPASNGNDGYDLRFTAMSADGEFANYAGSTIVRGTVVHDWGGLSTGFVFRTGESGRLLFVPGPMSIEPLPADVAARNGVRPESGDYWIEPRMRDGAARRSMLAAIGLPYGGPSSSGNTVCESTRDVTVEIRNFSRYATAGDASFDLADVVRVVSVDGPVEVTACADMGLHPAPLTVRGVLQFDVDAHALRQDSESSSWQPGLTFVSKQPVFHATYRAPASSAPTADDPHRIQMAMSREQQHALLMRLGVPDPAPDGRKRTTCGYRVPATVRLRELMSFANEQSPSDRDVLAVFERVVSIDGPVLQRPCMAHELRAVDVPEDVIAALKLPSSERIKAIAHAQTRSLLEN